MVEDNKQTGMARRSFLLYSCAAALSLATSSVRAQRAWGAGDSDFYSLNRDRFVASFEGDASSVQTRLIAGANPDTARSLCIEAREEFEKLLPGLPYIGGDNHPGTKWLLLAGHWLAFFRPMTARGYSTQEIARLMYDLYVEHLNTLPVDEMKKKGERRFSESYIQALKKQSDPKARFNEYDWVSNFVQGNGHDFDYGYDYLHCPCSEYFKTHGAAQLAPYFCLLDFPEHRLMGTGLTRTKTLALGDSVCDFRFKKGRQVLQDWSTEVPRFRLT